MPISISAAGFNSQNFGLSSGLAPVTHGNRKILYGNGNNGAVGVEGPGSIAAMELSSMGTTNVTGENIQTNP